MINPDAEQAAVNGLLEATRKDFPALRRPAYFAADLEPDYTLAGLVRLMAFGLDKSGYKIVKKP